MDEKASPQPQEAQQQEKPKRRRPGPARRRKASRRYRENFGKVERVRQYPLKEAIEVLQNTKPPKFEETFEVSIKLGIDPKKSDQLVRGSVPLPKGIGKTVKVLVFAEGNLADEAKAAGADIVGGKEIVDKIANENWVDFDIAIAHPSMMKLVGRLGKVLGPKGKMPSPKAGTVSPDIVRAIQEFKSGRVEYRTDSSGNVHAPVGKRSFPLEDLKANIETFIEHIKSVRPPSARGTYIQKISVSTTMGPGVFLEIKR